jgi:hypothetical protein
MPDPALSAAIKEAYASAPNGNVIYDTLEIWNPSFSVPIRVVREQHDPTFVLTAKLEATAPRNAGSLVSFTSYAFNLILPEQIASAVPTASLEIDNTDRTIVAQIETAARSGQETVLLWRQYLSSNLTVGPENSPILTLSLLTATATPFRVKGTAGFADMLNRKFPYLEYDPEVFTGLQK